MIGEGLLQFWRRFSASKDRLARFPRRTRGLIMGLPKIQDAGFGAARPGAPPKTWSELNDHPIELLRDIRRYLGETNRRTVTANRRLRWADHCLRYACPAIRKIYSEHHKGEALPEIPDRREGLIAAIDASIQLAIAYKQVLRHDYDLPDAAYLSVQQRAERSAFTILMLIRIEQRLRALRYQKLMRETWLDCNQIFFAMQELGADQQPFPDPGCLRLQSQRRSADSPAAQSTLAEQYSRIQLYGFFETNTLPSQHLHMLDYYLQQFRAPVAAAAPDSLPALQAIHDGQDPPRIVLSGANVSQNDQADGDGTAPQFRMRIGGNAVVAMWPLKGLKTHLEDECEKARRPFDLPEKDDQSRVIINKEDTGRLLVVDTMLRQLQLPQRKHARQAASTLAGDLYVYTGFSGVFRLLNEYSGEDKSGVLADNELRDALAGASALITDDAGSAGQARWVVLDESAGGLLVSTRETPFTNAIYIGQLVAFARNRDELSTPVIGYISRMNRNRNGEVEIAIPRLAEHAEVTAVQSAFLDRNDLGLPGILIRGEAGRWHLILHHSHRVSPGSRVFVTRDGRRYSLIASAIQYLQREFVIFDLVSAKGAGR